MREKIRRDETGNSSLPWMKLLPPLLFIVSACHSIGPGTIPRDRFNYTDAISRSWNEQMLLSIVKLRYLDMPMFVEVSSVITQYVLSGELSFGSTCTPA